MDMVTFTVQLPPVDAPLVHDTKDKVSKDRLHKEDLWYELKPDECFALIVDMVKDVQADSKCHLQGVSYIYDKNITIVT